MAFCLKIKLVCQRIECASTLDPLASLLPVLSIITLNHLKSGCRDGDVIKRGDVYRGEAKNGGCSSKQKRITCTLIHAPKISDTLLFLPFYYSPEGRRRYPSNSLPHSLPRTQHLLNKQQFATQNYLTLFRARPSSPSPPPPPPFRRADKCFFPACSFNICHPKSGVGRRRSQSVSLVAVFPCIMLSRLASAAAAQTLRATD